MSGKWGLGLALYMNKIKPPMVITKEDANMFLTIFDDELTGMGIV